MAAKNKRSLFFGKLLTTPADTSKPKRNKKTAVNFDTSIKKIPALDTSFLDDSTIKRSDTSGIDTARKVFVDTMNLSRDSLDAEVNYSAEDSGVLVISSKNFYLYGKANSSYKDIKLDANTIEYNQSTQVIKAFGGTDTSLGVLNKPKLVQGESETISDTISFNMKTQRGLTKNTFYKEGEMFINAERAKKVDKDVMYAYRTKFTTCNLDTPHFAFVTKKLKVVNNKIAVSGPTHPEFEGVPVPIILPFGIYPLNRGRHSGLLPPQFASNQDFGLGLEGLGYYKVLGDNWDVTVRTNIYSYGGWNLNINPEYYKRYKYRGNFNLALQKTKILNSGVGAKEEFTTSNSFFITWSHTSDQRARPGTSFSASVRAGSTKYNQYLPNNSYANFNNQLNSSITWNKTWDQGKYSLSIAGNHDQNNNSGLINIRLPTVNFSAATVYPFQKKEFVGTPKWYEKLGVSYSGTLLNQISFYDSLFDARKLLDTAQWGADHRIPITLSLPPLGPFVVAPNISYAERWYGQQIIKVWDPKLNKVDTTIKRGFYAAREVSMGLSFNTRIFGTFNFPHSKTIKAIRHEIKPYMGINYKPDLVKQYYSQVQLDSAGTTKYTYSYFDGGVISPFSQGKFGGMTFGIDNLFEMKVRDKKDTSAASDKKVRLIDGLSFSSGYNFLADSLQWSPIAIALRSTLFNKINITGSTSIDPYAIDTLGRRVNDLLWKRGKIGRISGASFAVSTSFSSKKKDDKKDEDRISPDETLTPDEQLAQLEYVRQNPAEFVDFNIPWNVSLSFSLSLYRSLTPDYKSYNTTINSNLSVNGDFSLTPKWKAGGNTYFDFRTAKIQSLTMFITREMHCWQMSINITPVGLYRSFNITLNPKSGILRDLRINRSRFFYSQ